MKKSEKPFVVEELKAQLKDAKSVTVIDYQGMPTKEMASLRKNIKDAGGVFTVAKNTLLKLAFGNSKIDNNLTGPTAVVFAQNDEIVPLQIIGKSIKTSGFPKLKFGIFGPDVIDAEKLLVMSNLPGKNVLFGQLVGVIAGPAYSLVGTLNGNLQKLVYILNTKAQKGGE